MKRKGQAGIYGLVGVILVFIVLGIVAALGLTVTEDVKNDVASDACKDRSDSLTSFNKARQLCQNPANASQVASVQIQGWNSTTDAELAVGKVSGKATIIATAAVFAIILTIIIGIVAAVKLRG